MIPCVRGEGHKKKKRTGDKDEGSPWLHFIVPSDSMQNATIT